MKKKKKLPMQAPMSQELPATLKDLLNPEIVDKLKNQAKILKEDEEKQIEEKRKQAEEIRKIEQKRLENDFQYLLENSNLDWKTYK